MKSMREIFRSYAVLDADGRHVNGTDKESNHHYGDAYESLFPDRTAVRLMMEVGVADGSSLLSWRDIFPNALCVGMDIHSAARLDGLTPDKDRIEFHLGDQCQRVDCLNAAGVRKFDLIVDDATHQLDHTLLTLYWLWPYVRPGGMYVVEEWPNVGHPVDQSRIRDLWPSAEVVGTCGPSGRDEPLVVFRRPL